MPIGKICAVLVERLPQLLHFVREGSAGQAVCLELVKDGIAFLGGLLFNRNELVNRLVALPLLAGPGVILVAGCGA